MEAASIYWIYALGFLGQGLFGARLVVQLLYSERAKRVMSPTLFWRLSLAASFLFLVYGILRNDLVIMLGQTVSYFIYIRNLQLKNEWTTIHQALCHLLVVLPFVAIGGTIFFASAPYENLLTNNDLSNPIIFLGAIGQLMLNLRFVYQWYCSEKSNESVLPVGFWVISTVASIFVLVYAGYRFDPVLLVAQGLGILVYIRNTIIHYNARTQSVV